MNWMCAGVSYGHSTQLAALANLPRLTRLKLEEWANREYIRCSLATVFLGVPLGLTRMSSLRVLQLDGCDLEELSGGARESVPTGALPGLLEYLWLLLNRCYVARPESPPAVALFLQHLIAQIELQLRLYVSGNLPNAALPAAVSREFAASIRGMRDLKEVRVYCQHVGTAVEKSLEDAADLLGTDWQPGVVNGTSVIVARSMHLRVSTNSPPV